MELLKNLVAVHSPTGEEFFMKKFIIDYVFQNQHNWKKKPQLIYGDDWMDCLLMIFGQPQTAIFVHMDTVGFHVRYDKELINIGTPVVESNIRLVGNDHLGDIDCLLDAKHPDYHIAYSFHRDIDRGTSLTFKPLFKEKDEFVEATYLDNRVGIWVALKLAEIAVNAAIVFTCGEEQKGGSIGFAATYLYQKYNLRQALIADVSSVNRGIKHGAGAIISRRDAVIPRKKFFDKIVQIAHKNHAVFQIEVEYSGSTDGAELQLAPIPVDWCFVGAPIENIHSPIERIHKIDIFAMFYLYSVLLKNL